MRRQHGAQCDKRTNKLYARLHVFVLGVASLAHRLCHCPAELACLSDDGFCQNFGRSAAPFCTHHIYGQLCYPRDATPFSKQPKCLQPCCTAFSYPTTEAIFADVHNVGGCKMLCLQKTCIWPIMAMVIYPSQMYAEEEPHHVLRYIKSDVAMKHDR